jgi:hypothetical protein
MDRAEELKHLARQRREMKLQDMRDNVSYADRVIPSMKKYSRNPKHRPQNAFEWEELED